MPAPKSLRPVSPSTLILARAHNTLSHAAFSQARYINRIYGILDGVEGLVYDVPDKPLHKGLKIVLHSVGAVGYHVLEHVALVLMIIRRCDPEKIPRFKVLLLPLFVSVSFSRARSHACALNFF